MTPLKLILGILFVVIYGYTIIVISSYGFDFLSPFLVGLAAFDWAGQFNLDFLTYLILSALWVAWRHRFNAIGLMCGGFALIGGMMFFSVYLLVMVHKSGGENRKLVLGDQDEL
ncbi:MAG: hypothetical protein AAF217_02400 [Pseudomonadota bacterium]